jgi:hypothetical protein
MHKLMMFSEFMDYLNHLMGMATHSLEHLADSPHHHLRQRHREEHHNNHHNRHNNRPMMVMGELLVVMMMMMMAMTVMMEVINLIYGENLATMQNRHH